MCKISSFLPASSVGRKKCQNGNDIKVCYAKSNVAILVPICVSNSGTDTV